MKKEKSLAILIAEADKVFSEYIRRSYAGEYGMVTCSCGCGVRRRWKLMQASHFVGRINMNTRYLENNVVPATMECNFFDEDHQQKIGVFINNKFGEGTTDYLVIKGASTTKLMRYEIQNIIDYYKHKLKQLK